MAMSLSVINITNTGTGKFSRRCDEPTDNNCETYNTTTNMCEECKRRYVKPNKQNSLKSFKSLFSLVCYCLNVLIEIIDVIIFTGLLLPESCYYNTIVSYHVLAYSCFLTPHLHVPPAAHICTMAPA